MRTAVDDILCHHLVPTLRRFLFIYPLWLIPVFWGDEPKG